MTEQRKRAQSLLRTLFFGLALGALGGLLGAITAAGPVNYEWVGPILASLLVFFATWAAYELSGIRASLLAVLLIGALTFWITFYPPYNDVFAMQGVRNSQLWVYLAPVAALGGTLFATVLERFARNREVERDA